MVEIGISSHEQLNIGALHRQDRLEQGCPVHRAYEACSTSVVQRELQNPLAGQILEGRIGGGDRVQVSANSDGLIINGQMVEAA